MSDTLEARLQEIRARRAAIDESRLRRGEVQLVADLDFLLGVASRAGTDAPCGCVHRSNDGYCDGCCDCACPACCAARVPEGEVARIAVLEAALAPFAAMARHGDEDGEQAAELVVQRGVASDMTVIKNRDWARARAALGGEKGPDSPNGYLQFEGRLQQLAALPEGWDSYGSARITPEAIQAARVWAVRVQVFPRSNGGLQIGPDEVGQDVFIAPDGTFEERESDEGGEKGP